MLKVDDFGRKIREARQRAGLSQRKLADVTKLHQCQISDIETGYVKLERVEVGTMIKLCNALEVTPNELLNA